MLPLPESLVQVESDKVISFVPPDHDHVLETQNLKFMGVGWRWSDVKGHVSVTTYCLIKRDRNGSPYHA